MVLGWHRTWPNHFINFFPKREEESQKEVQCSLLFLITNFSSVEKPKKQSFSLIIDEVDNGGLEEATLNGKADFR